MKKRHKIVRKLHNHEINHTEKSGYFTYVDDDAAPGGKRFIRKATEEALMEVLAETYIEKAEERKLTLKDVYEKWIEWKETPLNRANIDRIRYSWKAYYLNETVSQEIINKPLRGVTSLDLRTWAESLMKKHLPDKHKFYRLFQIVKECYEFASDEDRMIVPVDLWAKARKKLNRALMVKRKVPDDITQVFSDEELQSLRDMVYEDLERYKKQSSSAGLQILFLLQTGLRIGECCALKWSDVRNGRIYIYKQANNSGIKDYPKTDQSNRDIPLSDEALRILEDVRAFNEEHGYNADWIFQSGNPDFDYRLSYHAADRKLRKLCDRIDSVEKSPHKCRKTFASILLDSGMNPRTVQKLMGHEELSTTYNYYDFDRTSKEEQAIALNRALSPKNPGKQRRYAEN